MADATAPLIAARSASTAEHAGWSLGWVQAIADACRGLNCLADLDTSRFEHTVQRRH
jgi:hypothetical protein